MRITFGNLKLTVCRMAKDTSDLGKIQAGDCINDAQEEIQRRHNWSFKMTHAAEVVLTAGTAQYPFPAVFHHLNYVYYLDSNGKQTFLDPDTGWDHMVKIDEGTAGTPTKYRIYGNTSSPENEAYLRKFEIGPAPSSSFCSIYGSKLYLEEHEIATPMTADDNAKYMDWPPDFTLCLKTGAASLFCAEQGDDSGFQRFAVLFERTLKALIIADKKRLRGSPKIRVARSMSIYPWKARRKG